MMARILEASQTLPDGEVAWPGQLDRWMRELRVRLLRHPAILAMIGRSGRTSPAWLDASSALVEILGRAGLADRDPRSKTVSTIRACSRSSATIGAYAMPSPDIMLFNIQGPCPGGSSPHVDATRFRGLTLENTPVWLMNILVKTGLFERWQERKPPVIAWYYEGRIGGGFSHWPDGPHAQTKQIRAPMWGRAAVVENEMMFHTAEACGTAALRMPKGLAFHSLMGPDPERTGGWQITTDGEIIQRISEEEFRFLVHWGASLYKDLRELKTAADHTDDIRHEQVFEILIADLARRGVRFEMPSDPLTDKRFIAVLNDAYGIEKPLYFPPEPEESMAA